MPRKEQRRGMQGRARRSRLLGATDPRNHRDPQAVSRGDTYNEPLFVGEDGNLALRVDDSTSPAIEVGPNGLRFDETAQFVLPDPLNVTNLQRGGVEVGYLSVILFGEARTGSSPPWNTGATAEFPQASTTLRNPMDLRRYDEVRFRFISVLASAASSTLQLMFSTTATGALSQIDVDGTTLVLTSAPGTIQDTTWHDLEALAKVDDVYVGITQVAPGANRSIVQITAEFRAKPAA